MYFPVLVSFLLLTCSVSVGTSDQRGLSRRRYLTFPKGSNFVFTVANPKRLLTDARPKGWNGLLECDVLYPLPTDTRSELRGRLPRGVELLRADRRRLHAALEHVLHMHDLEGKACVRRILCEATTLLGSGDTLLQQVMATMFTSPRDGQPSHESHGPDVNNTECVGIDRKCPLSVLSVLLAWVQ